jgi:hypothetical protein
MSKKLQVLVMFEFDGIDDPDSVEAEIAVDDIGHLTKSLYAECNATTIWVEEVMVVGKEDET